MKSFFSPKKHVKRQHRDLNKSDLQAMLEAGAIELMQEYQPDRPANKRKMKQKVQRGKHGAASRKGMIRVTGS